jgi:hypothetical protein
MKPFYLKYSFYFYHFILFCTFTFTHILFLSSRASGIISTYYQSCYCASGSLIFPFLALSNFCFESNLMIMLAYRCITCFWYAYIFFQRSSHSFIKFFCFYYLTNALDLSSYSIFAAPKLSFSTATIKTREFVTHPLVTLPLVAKSYCLVRYV